MKNKELSRIFDELADMLEFEGEDPFKIRAYRNVARVLDSLQSDVEEIAKEGRLTTIPGIGSKIAAKIEEYLKTGKMKKYEEIRERVPPGVLEMMKIPGIGAKTVKRLYQELAIADVNSLEKAIEDGRLYRLAKVGEKTVEKIKKGIRMLRSMQGRVPLGIALPVARRAVNYLLNLGGIKDAQPAGSLRRMKSTVGDIDILVASVEGGKITGAFVEAPFVREKIACGETKASVIVDEGLQVDVRVISPDSFGSALQYFTGSKAHNIHLRRIAVERKWKLSEYGLFNENGERIASETEEEVYHALGLEWIPPEIREDQGEIELAEEGKLPRLVTLEDIQGDLHVHSTYSDGSATPERLQEVAQGFHNYKYVAVADHSRSLKVAKGLSVEKLREKIKHLKKLNEGSEIYLIPSAEVDILPDGSLDYPDEVLKELEFVIASVHSKFSMSRKEMTERIVKAMENPYVNVIAHPSGVLLGEREPYEVDWDQIFKKASQTGTALEINSYYRRLDLSDVLVRGAISHGVLISIGSDAHHEEQLWLIELGVGIARRGWCEKEHIINTWDLSRIKEWVLHKRNG